NPPHAREAPSRSFRYVEQIRCCRARRRRWHAWAGRCRAAWRCARVSGIQHGTARRFKEGRLSYARSAHEGTKEIRATGSAKTLPVLEALRLVVTSGDRLPASDFLVVVNITISQISKRRFIWRLLQ